MANSNGDGGVSGSSCHVAGSSHGAGSSLDGGSRGHEGRREGDIPYDADGSRDKDNPGHGKGSPVELLNYNVPAPWDDQTTTSDSDTNSCNTEHPDSAQGNPAEYSTECLSGVLPFFEIELVNTHVAKRYRLLMPRKAMRILPNVDVVVTLRHGLQEWKGTYHGSYKRPVINKNAWKSFVDDNHLKAGDIFTFELEKLCDICGVWLKVLLLKGPFDSPAERLAQRMAGTSEDHAIVID